MVFGSMKNIVTAIAIISCTTQASFSDTVSSNNVSNPNKTKTLNGGVKKSASKPETWGQRHPKMKAAAVGGGIGAAAGGTAGLLTGRGVVRGAAIGAGAGAGAGVLRKTAMAKKHPIASDAATGVIAGAGLGLASGRKHKTVEGALLGGAAGLGVGLWKNRKDL